MTEIGWWYTAIFFIIIAVFYAIGFWAGKNWGKSTQQEKQISKVKKK